MEIFYNRWRWRGGRGIERLLLGINVLFMNSSPAMQALG
jgi:hypothetical protein